MVRLEQRLGYVHKGIEGLMAGADLERAVQLAGRVSGDSTVAYAYAFSRAAEAALGLAAPDRAAWLRALAAELERLANHLGDIGAICNDASFALIHAHTSVLRESVLRAANAAFGHRLMRNVIVPGGVTRDLDDGGREAIYATLDTIRLRFPSLIELYDNTASLQDRTVDTGLLKPALAKQYAAGGYVGRASGRSFDARRTLAYPPYDDLHFEVPVLNEGDVNARVWIRVREVEQSLSLIDQILDRLPEGALRAKLTPRMAAQRAWRGKVWPSSRDFAATFWSGCACATAGSNAAICATPPGFNGRCWRPPSRATSSRTFRSATSRSTVPIRVWISRMMTGPSSQ